MAVDRSLRATTPNERAMVGSHVRRVFLKALQTFFGESGQVEDQYLWREDSAQSKLVIAAEFTQELLVNEPNHSILVNRGPVNFQKTSIDNAVQRNPRTMIQKGGPDGGNPPQGLAHKFAVMCFTEMQVVCFSVLPGEAEALAQMALAPLLLFQRQIRKSAQLHRIDNPQLGTESPVSTSDSKIWRTAVPITVPVAFPLVWETRMDPKLIEVDWDLEEEKC